MTVDSVKDQEIDEISQKIMLEIEQKSSKELAESEEITKIFHLTDVRHAKTLLQHSDEVPSPTERDVGKRAVVKALLLSVWLQRLYFVVNKEFVTY